MFRKKYQDLEKWEKDSVQEPLMLIGVRQVGKTWLIREFCRNTYQDWFYVNLEEQPSYQSAFEGDLSPETILRNLGVLSGRRLTKKTAIVIDEIQVCERAITSLKYFCESGDNYRVITAGSLLGVKINRFSSSFPVGKVKLLPMFPMDFEEYLTACGETLLRDAVADAFSRLVPLPAGIHEKALKLCFDYMIVGGMPKAVDNYVQTGKNISAFNRDIHRDLTISYLADMTKYVSSPYETEKISQVYRSIPRQLARENPKFKYSDVRPHANRRDFAAPVDWLKASGMICKVDSLDLPRSPLNGYVNESIFKIYLSDAGMLASLCGLMPRDLASEESNQYKGAVVENYIIQEFASRQRSLYYYKPSESMEIDLIYDDGNDIIPVEIKSGRHKRSTSLVNYQKQYHPKKMIRFSALNMGNTGELFSIPLYAAFCLP